MTSDPKEALERLTPAEAWQDLLDKDDRTSPSDTPEMALITFEELRDYMQSVAIAEREGLEQEVERQRMSERALKQVATEALDKLAARDRGLTEVLERRERAMANGDRASDIHVEMANDLRALLDRTAGVEGLPRPGEIRNIQGQWMRFIECEIEGDVWEPLAAGPVQDVAGLGKRAEALLEAADQIRQAHPALSDEQFLGYQIALSDVRAAALLPVPPSQGAEDGEPALSEATIAELRHIAAEDHERRHPDVSGLVEALERIAGATPGSTNSATAAEMRSWTYAVASCALDAFQAQQEDGE